MSSRIFQPSLSRRAFTTGAAALGVSSLAAPMIGRAAGLTKVRITQPTDSLSYMSIYTARAKGYFEAEGIDVEVVITKGDGPDVEALMAKEVEFVATPPNHLYTLYNQGRQLLGVCGLLNRCTASVVISKDAAEKAGVDEHSPFDKKLAAFKGLTVGTSAPGSLTYNLSEYYIIRAGMNPQKDARVIASGAGTAAIAAMKNKIVNAYCFSSPLTDQLVEGGDAVWLINNTLTEDPALQSFLYAVIYVRPDYLQANEDLCRRMIRAIVKGSAYAHSADFNELATTLRPFFSKLDEKLYMSALGNVRPAVAADGKMTAEANDAIQKMLLTTGHLKKAVPFDAVLTNKYLPS